MECKKQDRDYEPEPVVRLFNVYLSVFIFYQFSQKTRYVQEDKPIGVQPEQLSTNQTTTIKQYSTEYRILTKDKYKKYILT